MIRLKVTERGGKGDLSVQMIVYHKMYPSDQRKKINNDNLK